MRNFNLNNLIDSLLERAHAILKEVYPQYIMPNISYIKITKANGYWANIGKCKDNISYGIHIGSWINKMGDESLLRLRLQSCLIHELIHTQPGCMNHGKEFKHICKLVNDKYPQYKVKTSTSESEFGLEEINKPKYKHKYILKCKSCGYEYYYSRKPKYPIEMYLCAKCKCSHMFFISNV